MSIKKGAEGLMLVHNNPPTRDAGVLANPLNKPITPLHLPRHSLSTNSILSDDHAPIAPHVNPLKAEAKIRNVSFGANTSNRIEE